MDVDWVLVDDRWTWKNYKIIANGYRFFRLIRFLPHDSILRQSPEELLGYFNTLDEAKDNVLLIQCSCSSRSPIHNMIRNPQALQHYLNTEPTQSAWHQLKTSASVEQKPAQIESQAQKIMSETTPQAPQGQLSGSDSAMSASSLVVRKEEAVALLGSQDESSGASAEPRDTSPAKITHEMSIPEILKHLSHHGCKDVTGQLDMTESSEYPVSTGGFGDVYRGALRNGSRVSLKCLRLHMDSTDIGKKQLKRAAHELYVWSKCKHPCVLTLIGVAEYRNRIAMVSPWMENGNLRHLLSRQPKANRSTICIQIADGVAYLHSEGIVHGDIKGDNVLFSQDFVPKLADFGNGILREYTLQFATTTSRASTSLNWAAPEMLEDETGPSAEADVYSLGMTILEVITGLIPYPGMRDFVIIRKIMSKEHPARPKCIPAHNKQADFLWSLLTSCWAYSPNDRPTAIEVRDKMKMIDLDGVSGTQAC